MERKNAKTRRETAVQGTNDSSIVSKCSTSSCGYFDDPFLHLFVSKHSRRAPLIHRGYYIRAKAFDTILQRFLKQNLGCKTQIISLGCGFDSTYFRLKDLQVLSDTVFFEVDFPDLVKRKRMLIENTQVLMRFLVKSEKQPSSPHIELSCQDYHLLGVDLTQLNTLEAALKMCGIDFEVPTLLFSECVMTYMTRRCSTDLVKWAAETFDNAVFGMYEQIHPDDAFGLFMQNHFHSIGSPLKCINAFPTLASQTERFLKAGWTFSEILDMNAFYYQCLPSSEQRRVENLEAFDEYEELNLKYSHYFILIASILPQSTSLITGGKQLEDPHPTLLITDNVTIERFPAKESVRRFGHSSSVISNSYILTTGGFGEIDGRHQRLTDITVTSIQSLVSYHIQCATPSDMQYSRMHHASVALSDGTVYLIAGRQSPYFMCSQMLKISSHFESENDSEVVLHHIETGFSNCASGKSRETVEKRIINCENVNSKECGESHLKSTKRSPDLITSSNDRSDCDTMPNSSLAVQNTDISLKTGTCPFGNIDVEIVEQTGTLPCDRWRHAVTTVAIDGKDKIFLHGGKTKNGQVLSDAYLFEPAICKWVLLTCTGEDPGSRHSHSVVYWNNHVVLTGGLNETHLPTGQVYLLNLNSFVWSKLDVAGHLSPRYSHCTQVMGDKLVLIGGVNLAHPPPGVAVINPGTKRALEFAMPAQEKSSLLMFHRHTSIALDSNRILVLGGGGNCFSFGTHLNRTPVILNVGSALDLVN